VPFLPQFTVRLDDILTLSWALSPDNSRITVEASLVKNAW
jgi:hypothetical protein